jgi:hydroxyacylglutathione hydrolase
MGDEMRFGSVRFIPGENNGKYPYCHSLYVEGAGILIDPASDRERLERLREEEGVRAVWLSHWHEDHLMHLDLFDDVPLWICEDDAPPLADIETFLNWYDMEDPEYREHWRTVLAAQFHLRPRKPTGFLKGGDRIDLGSVTVEVIHTPGHTPGHLAFFFEEPQAVFLGDYDLTRFGPWYGDRYSSIQGTVDSVRTLRQREARVWLTGHETGVFQESPDDLWDPYLAVIWERERKLLDLLREPRTMEEVVNAWIVYGRPREPMAFFEFGERAIMGKHLQVLETEGHVTREDGRYVLVR